MVQKITAGEKNIYKSIQKIMTKEKILIWWYEKNNQFDGWTNVNSS